MKKERVLVLGAGTDRMQRVNFDPSSGQSFDDNFEKVITLDRDPAAKPDVLMDLTAPYWPLNVKTKFGLVDEVHAYEVLHVVSFGSTYTKAGGFFTLWKMIWDVLKPDGFVIGMTPWWESVWAWQDPSTTQVYSAEQLKYLDHRHYADPMMTNYSGIWPEPYNFVLRHASMRGENPKNAGFTFILQKENYESKDQGGSDRSPGDESNRPENEVLGGSTT